MLERPVTWQAWCRYLGLVAFAVLPTTTSGTAAAQSPPDPADAVHFVAVATSPAPTWSFEAAETGHYGLGWHEKSGHDAGRAAEAACKGQGGDSCIYTAASQSMRGGCVGLAIAGWRDQDRDPKRAYVTATSTFREAISRDLRSACSVAVFGGKRRETVAEHSCDVIEILCADDVEARPTADLPPTDTGAPDDGPEGTWAASCEGWNTFDFFEVATPGLVKRCIDAGADPNAGHDEARAKPQYGFLTDTPMSVSIILDRWDIVAILLDAGARVDGPDHPCTSPPRTPPRSLTATTRLRS